MTSFDIVRHIYPAYYRKHLKWLKRVKLNHRPLEMRVYIDRKGAVHFMPYCLKKKMESAPNMHTGFTPNYKPFGEVWG